MATDGSGSPDRRPWLAGGRGTTDRRLPVIGLVPASVLGWGAMAGLVVWTLLVTPISNVAAVPGHLGWLALVATLVVSTALGARTASFRLELVLLASAIVFVLVDAAGIYGLDHTFHAATRFIAASGAVRLSGAVAVLGLAGLLLGRLRRAMLRSAELMMAAVLLLFLFVDVVVLRGQLLRDFRLYLAAGDTFFHGGQPYLTSLFTTLPTDQAGLPFLYPPFTLPIFGLLAQAPQWLVLPAWVAASVGAAILGLRQLGVRPWAIAALLLWPPFFEGLAVGNVAVLTFAVFAVAPMLPAALPSMAVFKLQSAIPSLWLVRARRWRSLIVGCAAVVAIGLITLPVVGLTSWAAWVNALLLFQQSQHDHHYLFALALPGYIPYVLYVVIALGVTILAFWLGRGRAGLARLGVASIVASPSLYRHGFLVALPGLLGNDELVFWLALGVAGTEVGWWLLAVAAFVGSFRFAAAARRPMAGVHPLGAGSAPWGGIAQESALS